MIVPSNKVDNLSNLSQLFLQCAIKKLIKIFNNSFQINKIINFINKKILLIKQKYLYTNFVSFVDLMELDAAVAALAHIRVVLQRQLPERSLYLRLGRPRLDPQCPVPLGQAGRRPRVAHRHRPPSTAAASPTSQDAHAARAQRGGRHDHTSQLKQQVQITTFNCE